MENRSLVFSVVNQHCPYCRSEKMFTYPVYSKKFNVMHRKCPNCSQHLEPEPGFYTGAMYVSYALQVGIIFAVIIFTTLLGFDASLGWYIGWIAGLVILLFPIVYRLSRSVWAHILIPFRGKELVRLKKHLLDHHSQTGKTTQL